MPTLTMDELRAAPSRLTIREKTINFIWDKPPEVYRYTGNGEFDRSTRLRAAVSVVDCFEQLPEPCENIDEVRLDFAWIVHDGEFWAVEVKPRGDGYVVWNDWILSGWANEGPNWVFGSEVLAVVGLTDLDGQVWLMGASTTVVEIPRF